ncbi:hypothetical protein HanXRQr2_Chr08g0349921 [Helianthus annuus]|uniref:Uncharacterized protein n=1 Tax=Helianthus annuus TaxID=4232 RepID=A0A251U8R3_HELAN|nr:hypothetical protein HanXRQr2_Chr08g0349921 [Helianthus annuus]
MSSVPNDTEHQLRYRYMKFGLLSVQEGKNRHQHGTENAKSRYQIDFENLLVREIRYYYPVPFAHS